jgi:hypothetical protein
MVDYLPGIVLFGLGLAMIFIGRAREGVPQPWLRSYPIGVLYTMTTMTSLVFGVSWILLKWVRLA